MCFCFGAEIAADWGTEFEGAAGEMQRMSTFPSRCRHCCALNPIFVAALFLSGFPPKQVSQNKRATKTTQGSGLIYVSCLGSGMIREDLYLSEGQLTVIVPGNISYSPR